MLRPAVRRLMMSLFSSEMDEDYFDYESEFIIKVKKRTIEVIERATTNEEEVELLRLWKKKRQPSGEEINR